MKVKMPGKKVIRMICLFLGLFGFVYLLLFSPIGGRMHDGKRVYRADSLLLKFADGEVAIKAKDGHIAYIGTVKKGYADGEGALYDKQDNLVYQGSFAKSMYAGEGTLYYASGIPKYQGGFVLNQFDGTGALYNEMGLLQYEGQFSGGMKNGTGTLYDAAGEKIYTGSFLMDEPVYQWFLGRNGMQIAQVYEGEMNPAQVDGTWLVTMPALSMSYSGAFSEEMEGGVVAQTLYISKDCFVYGKQKLHTLSEIQKVLGEPLTSGSVTPSKLERAACSAFQIEGDVVATVFFRDEVTYTFFSLKGQDDFFMIELQGA